MVAGTEILVAVGLLVSTWHRSVGVVAAVVQGFLCSALRLDATTWESRHLARRDCALARVLSRRLPLRPPRGGVYHLDSGGRRTRPIVAPRLPPFVACAAKSARATMVPRKQLRQGEPHEPQVCLQSKHPALFVETPDRVCRRRGPVVARRARRTASAAPDGSAEPPRRQRNFWRFRAP